MTLVDEIKDEDTFRTWLEDLPEAHRDEWAVTLATRAAQRVFPFWAAEMPAPRAREGDLTGVPMCRCLLISAVAVTMPTADIKQAAASAATVWKAVQWDGTAILAGGNAMDLPLWPDENPLADLWFEIRPKILSAENWQHGVWQFWVNWYEQMLDPVSNPPNWPLLERVALIDPEIWEAGPEAVSRKIAEIQRDFEVSTRPKPVANVGETSLISGGQAGLRGAMIANRRDLPPTFEAILAILHWKLSGFRNETIRATLRQRKRAVK